MQHLKLLPGTMKFAKDVEWFYTCALGVYKDSVLPSRDDRGYAVHRFGPRRSVGGGSTRTVVPEGHRT